MFSRLGETWFDEYWMNYRKITVKGNGGKTKLISSFREFIEYKNGDISLITPRRTSKK